MEKNWFGLKTHILNPHTRPHTHTYIYIYLKLVISKILNIAFLIATIMLSHINVIFQPTFVQLNLSKRFSKHEGYEYTNLIFTAVTHLF